MTASSTSKPIDSGQGASSQKRSNYRWILAIFAVLVPFMMYMDRVNLSIATPSIIKEFHFTLVQIGMMQTVFFVCYAALMIPSGIATEYFGHRRIVTLAVVWWSVFTAATAFCGKFSTWVVVRGLFGVGESPTFPSLNTALSSWFPKKERGTASGCLVAGSCLGQVVGLPLSVMIMVNWGWRTVFIIFAVLGLVLAAGYYSLLRTYPHHSKFVNIAELEYIADGQTTLTETSKAMAPWKDLFQSTQFWAITVPQSAANFINYIFIVWLPVYLLEARHFSLKQMGFASAFVFAGPAFGGMVAGIIADHVIRNRLGTSRIRAWVGGISLLLCGCGLYLTAVSTNHWLTVMWLALSLACVGASFSSSWASCTDIGGRFAGTITGWMNSCGVFIGGGLGPVLVAWVASRYSWRTAILVTATMGIIGAAGWIFVKPDVPLKNVG